jgi:hypothetical protein
MTTKNALTAGQDHAVRETERSHHALVEAQAHLHRALGRAQNLREVAWARLVARELRAAQEKIAAHRDEVRSDTGLYNELQIEAPWALPRIRKMDSLLQKLVDEASGLADHVEVICGGDASRVREIRPEAERMLQTLRTLMSEENDLIFERFREIGSLD